MKSLFTILLLGLFISSEAQNISQSQVRQFNDVPAYRVFGRGSGVGTPSFIQLDSNHIPQLHSQGYYDGRYGSLSVQNTNTSNISANTTAIALKADKSATISINGSSQTLGSNPNFTISQTLQQVLSTGSVLTTPNIVNQSANKLSFSGGGQFQLDSLKITPSVSGTGTPDSITSEGDSFTAGNGGAATDSLYENRLGRFLGVPARNRGVASTKVWDAVKSNLGKNSFPHNALTSLMSGFNDIAEADVTTTANRGKVNRIINGFKAVYLNQFAKTVISPSSGSVTRSGTWSTNWDATLEGGKSTTGAYTTLDASYIEYAFTDSTVAFEIMGKSTGGSAFTVTIDGVTVLTSTSNGQTDAVGHNYIPTPFIFNGLTFAPHTIRITKNGTGLFVMDYLTTLRPRSTAPTLLFFHVPKRTQFAITSVGGTGTSIQTDFINGKLDSLTTALSALGRPVYIAASNTYYNLANGVSSDSIHPNNAGHGQLFNAATAILNSISGSSGTIDYRTDGYFYGSSNGVSKRFGYQSDLGLQGVMNISSALSINNAISGSAKTLDFNNFSRIWLDSIMQVTPSTTIPRVDITGYLATSGTASTISIGARDAAGLGFIHYISGGLYRIYDGYNSRDAVFIDTSGRVKFGNAGYKLTAGIMGNGTPTASVHIAPNSSGIASHAPLKIEAGGTLMATPEAGAIETDSLNIYYTNKTPNRFTIAKYTTGGTAPNVGTATLSAGAATITTAAVTAGSVIELSYQSCSGCGTLYKGTITAGTSFVINSTNAGDASTVSWRIIY